MGYRMYLAQELLDAPKKDRREILKREKEELVYHVAFLNRINERISDLVSQINNQNSDSGDSSTIYTSKEILINKVKPTLRTIIQFLEPYRPENYLFGDYRLSNLLNEIYYLILLHLKKVLILDDETKELISMILFKNPNLFSNAISTIEESEELTSEGSFINRYNIRHLGSDTLKYTSIWQFDLFLILTKKNMESQLVSIITVFEKFNLYLGDFSRDGLDKLLETKENFEDILEIYSIAKYSKERHSSIFSLDVQTLDIIISVLVQPNAKAKIVEFHEFLLKNPQISSSLRFNFKDSFLNLALVPGVSQVLEKLLLITRVYLYVDENFIKMVNNSNILLLLDILVKGKYDHKYGSDLIKLSLRILEVPGCLELLESFTSLNFEITNKLLEFVIDIYSQENELIVYKATLDFIKDYPGKINLRTPNSNAKNSFNNIEEFIIFSKISHLFPLLSVLFKDKDYYYNKLDIPRLEKLAGIDDFVEFLSNLLNQTPNLSNLLVRYTERLILLNSIPNVKFFLSRLNELKFSIDFDDETSFKILIEILRITNLDRILFLLPNNLDYNNNTTFPQKLNFSILDSFRQLSTVLENIESPDVNKIRELHLWYSGKNDSIETKFLNFVKIISRINEINSDTSDTLLRLIRINFDRKNTPEFNILLEIAKDPKVSNLLKISKSNIYATDVSDYDFLLLRGLDDPDFLNIVKLITSKLNNKLDLNAIPKLLEFVSHYKEKEAFLFFEEFFWTFHGTFKNIDSQDINCVFELYGKIKDPNVIKFLLSLFYSLFNNGSSYLTYAITTKIDVIAGMWNNNKVIFSIIPTLKSIFPSFSFDDLEDIYKISSIVGVEDFLVFILRLKGIGVYFNFSDILNFYENGYEKIIDKEGFLNLLQEYKKISNDILISEILILLTSNIYTLKYSKIIEFIDLLADSGFYKNYEVDPKIDLNYIVLLSLGIQDIKALSSFLQLVTDIKTVSSNNLLNLIENFNLIISKNKFIEFLSAIYSNSNELKSEHLRLLFNFGGFIERITDIGKFTFIITQLKKLNYNFYPNDVDALTEFYDKVTDLNKFENFVTKLEDVKYVFKIYHLEDLLEFYLKNEYTDSDFTALVDKLSSLELNKIREFFPFLNPFEIKNLNFEQVKSYLLEKLHDSETLAVEFIRHLPNYLSEAWVEPFLKRSVNHYIAALELVEYSETTDLSGLPWFYELKLDANLTISLHDGSRRIQDWSPTDPFENDPRTPRIEQQRLANMLLSTMLGSKEFDKDLELLGYEVIELNNLLSEVSSIIDSSYTEFLNQLDKYSNISSEMKQFLRNPEHSLLKNSYPFIHWIRIYSLMYLIQEGNDDLFETLRNTNKLRDVLTHVYEEFLETFITHIPYYDLAYKQFDGYIEEGRNPSIIFLARDGLFAGFGRTAQLWTRMQMMGIQKRKEKKERGRLPILPKYLYFPRYFLENIKNDVLTEYLMYHGINDNEDIVFFDTGFVGTIPVGIFKILGNMKAENFDRGMALLSAEHSGRMIKGMSSASRANIVNGIEYSSEKGQNSAIGIIREGDRIRHIAEPLSAESQFLFYIIIYAIQTHYILDTLANYNPEEIDGQVEIDKIMRLIKQNPSSFELTNEQIEFLNSNPADLNDEGTDYRVAQILSFIQIREKYQIVSFDFKTIDIIINSGGSSEIFQIIDFFDTESQNYLVLKLISLRDFELLSQKMGYCENLSTKVARALINENQISLLAENLHSFNTLEKEVGIMLIEENFASWVIRHKSKFPGLTINSEVIKMIMDTQQYNAIAENLNDFDGLDASIFEILIENGWASNVFEHLNSFSGLVLDARLLNKVLDYNYEELEEGLRPNMELIIDKFPNNLDTNVAKRLISLGYASAVLGNYYKNFQGLKLNSEIANLIIDSGQEKILLMYLEQEHFDDLDKSVAHKLITIGATYDLASNIGCFRDLDSYTAATLMEHGFSNTFIENLDKFKDLSFLIIVVFFINYVGVGIPEEVSNFAQILRKFQHIFEDDIEIIIQELESLSAFGDFTANMLIDTGQIEYVTDYMYYFRNLSKNTAIKLHNEGKDSYVRDNPKSFNFDVNKLEEYLP